MPQTDDLLDQVELPFGQDDPIVKAAPLVEVMFQHPDRPLEGDKFLRTSALTSAAALTLPIPSVSV
jgi:hypothetical protein